MNAEGAGVDDVKLPYLLLKKRVPRERSLLARQIAGDKDVSSLDRRWDSGPHVWVLGSRH